MKAFFGSPDGPYVVRSEFRHEMINYTMEYYFKDADEKS